MEDYMRNGLDFGNFRRSSVGFDRLFDMLESGPGMGGLGENYPPFDLIRVDDNRFRIEVAVAGFKPSELDITAQQNVLIIRGERSEPSGLDYVHRGIANRSFERRFALADHIQVRGAEMKDGLLSLELVREIPEAMKPRRIEIGGSEQNAIESRPSSEVTPRHDSVKEDA
jgi:molecular chaperone IbpA